jgi:hypothetical protein
VIRSVLVVLGSFIAMALAVLMVSLSLASMRQSVASGQPRWYAMVLLMGMPLVALIGGRFGAPSA